MNSYRLVAQSWRSSNSGAVLGLTSTLFTYDNNGNMLTKTEGGGQTSFAWDTENRLTAVTLPGDGGTVSFKYDPFGRRIWKSTSSGTTVYGYDGANIVAEYSGTGTLVAKYAQVAGIDEPLAMWRGGATSFYQADGLGSITSLTDAAGSAVAAYQTDAFGKSIQSAGAVTNPFRYTGREGDSETNLYYYRARYYDPQIGRFITEDPLRFGGDGVDFYTYVNNNPISGYDPFGLRTKCMLAGPDGNRSLVCWDDGRGKQRRDGNDFVQLLDRPNAPANSQSMNAAAVAVDFNEFSNCADHVGVECNLPEVPKSGNPFSPPGGPTGDMGVTPNEGTVALPQFGDTISSTCNCFKRHPLAVYDPRFRNSQLGSKPGACLAPLF